jgi:hypothetical protein
MQTTTDTGKQTTEAQMLNPPSGETRECEAADSEIEGESDRVGLKKPRGRRRSNAGLHDVFAGEFKALIAAEKPSHGDRRLIKKIAQMMLYQGFSITEVSDSLRVPKSTVCVWRDKLGDEEKAKIEQAALNSIQGKICEFLGATFESMTAISRNCANETYVTRHSPEAIARLIDVLATHAFRLIEAKQRMDLAKLQIEVDSKIRQSQKRET